MSDDDDDGWYVPVPGFTIPFKRVLDAEERPANPDGSRTGSLFLTIEGCTFDDKARGIAGSAAATCGAPNVEIRIKDAQGRESHYLVEASAIVEAAIEAHLARKDWPGPQGK